MSVAFVVVFVVTIDCAADCVGDEVAWELETIDVAAAVGCAPVPAF